MSTFLLYCWSCNQEVDNQTIRFYLYWGVCPTCFHRLHPEKHGFEGKSGKLETKNTISNFVGDNHG